MLAELESLRRKVAQLDGIKNEVQRLAEELAGMEDRHEALYSRGPMFCVVVDPGGVLLDANQAALTCLGRSAEELEGTTLLDLLSDELDPDARSRLERAFSGRLSEQCEVGLRSGSGAIRRVAFLSAIPRKNVHGQTEGVLLAGADVTDQRQAEASLRSGDREYRALVDGLSVPVCWLDVDHRFAFANRAAGEAFGVRPDDLDGRSIREFLSDDDWKLVLDRTADMARGSTSPYEISIARPDGTTRCVSVHATLKDESGGGPSGMVVTLHPVTETRAIENALRESEAKYRSLFEESIDVIYITSESGRLLEISPSAVTLFGYTREEMLERDVHGLYADPSQRIEFQKAIEKDGYVRGFEITLLNKDGDKIHCLLSSTLRRGPDGHTVGYQGIMRDVTDRKRTEAGRERERATFRIIAEAAIRDSDVPQLCEHVLGGLVEILGFDGGSFRTYDAGAGVLRPVATVGLSDEERARIKDQRVGEDDHCTAAHVATTGQPIFAPDVSVHEVSDSHGERLEEFGIGSMVSYPIKGSGDDLLAVMQLFARSPVEISEEADKSFFDTVAGMLAAVIEKKQAEEEKRVVEAQLLQAQKMEAVGTLASGVAHDFNNLLTAIQGFTELSLMSVDESDRLHEDLEKIRSAADRGAALVRQLLLFGREQPIQPHPIDINSTTLGMVKMLAPLIGEDISVSTVLDDGLRSAMADEGSIQQVLMNLAVNARDAMPEGGSLTIRTRNVTLTEEHVAGDPDARAGDFVCVSVEDSGRGMDQDTMGRIFEPFFSTKGPGKGTGLGLSVVYGIVKQHGGWIYALSTPRMGTTFEVYLPASVERVSDGPPAARDTASGEWGAGERILVVEDEDSVRDLAATVLRKHGYEVFEAADVGQALEVFDRESGRFDLVFSDVVLPDRSGVHLANELLQRFPDLRVLMSSGHASTRSQWETIRNMGLPFLQKPYSLPGLLRIVRETISDGANEEDAATTDRV